MDDKMTPLTAISSCRLAQLATFIALWLAGHVNSQANQENIQVSYSMREQVPYNTPIGNIVDDADLRDSYPQSVIDSFQFGLLSGGRYNDYFQVDNSGNFATADPLDRENVCPSAEVCELPVDAVILQPVQFFTIFNLKITVQDRNDYRPTFPQDKLVINVSESTLPGAEFVIPPAVDLDSPQFGIQHYEIVPSISEFELVVTENSDGTQDMRLTLMERLDRETNARYVMELLVYDGGEPPKQGSMGIEVNLVDHNDNSPRFAQSTYNVTVDEDFALNTPIAHVYASDIDDGLNGLVKYGLSAQTQRTYGDLFQIDSTSGAITLGAHLDYEDHALYTIQVEASDHGVGSLPAVAKVYLYVLDVNDHEPAITISGLSPSGNIEIAEESNSGVPIAHIAVEDLDTGRNGEVECVAPNSEDFILQTRQGSTFMLVSARTYDYETQTTYNLPLICRDHGTPQLSTSVDISISIVDVNDNAPIFDTNTYALRFRENNSIDDPVLQVTANDQDSGDNGRITYELNAQARNMLHVDPDTGVITARVVFDYESMHTYMFYVTAWDNGDPRKSDNSTVVITLIDTNDEVPVFTQRSYTFGTFENQDIGTEIATIQATDNDTAPYDEFRFSLDAHSVAMNVFDIDAISGELVTLRILDREHVPTYHLTVIATNTAFPRLSSTVDVTVYVGDRNDNAPLITFPTMGNDSVQVPSNAARGSIFTRILAQDADLGQNQLLEFTIAGGNEEGLFAVDLITGAMSVRKELIDTERTTYELLISVHDQGDGERKSAVTTLNIYVNQTMPVRRSKERSGDSMQDSHKLAIIILGAVTAVLVVILVTAIIMIKRRQVVAMRQSNENAYKVEVARHHGVPPSAPCGDAALQQKPVNVTGRDFEKCPDDRGPASDRTHLTLEDIKRMKCLYRNTPDVARHEPLVKPETRANYQGHAYNVRKNAEMLGIFDLLSDGESPIDDESTDSNADSGHGTSETGNDVSAQKINLSDERPAVVNKQGVLTPVHVYLQDTPPVTSPKPRDNHVSTFGAHLHRLPPAQSYAPSQQTEHVQRHKPQQHVTFDLSNQSPSHKQYHPKPAAQNPSASGSHIPQSAFQRTHAEGSHPRPVMKGLGPDSSAPYMDMTKGSRRQPQPPHLAVTSNQSEVSESCDNISVASTTSGEYFVQLDNGPLQSVQV